MQKDTLVLKNNIKYIELIDVKTETMPFDGLTICSVQE